MLTGGLMFISIAQAQGSAPASGQRGPTNVEDPKAMALAHQIATMPSPPLDSHAAWLLAKYNGCFRRHAIEKQGKPGPTWRSVAERFRPLPPAIQPIVQERLIYHLVSGERANFPDGHSEYH
jgi:cytochrome c